MAFVWCPSCKKHLVPQGIHACRTCADSLKWSDDRYDEPRIDLSHGDMLLVLSVVAAALMAMVLAVWFAV